MAVDIKELLAYCDAELKPGLFDDYCPNGLQVQGRASVEKIVCGVTASQALIDRAVALQADVLLVHHGFFWKGGDPCLVGIKRRRLAALLAADINLLVYHLPLDAHPVLGNNVQLALRLGIELSGSLQPGANQPIGNVGRLPEALAPAQFCQRLEAILERKPLLIEAGSRPIETIGWCTGAAQAYIDQAAELGVDAFLSGEISESTVHIARERGIHYIAAGHHATERYGVQALGEALAQRFGLNQHFIDIDNPV